jgi:outer membrane protein assembly factor BamB
MSVQMERETLEDHLRKATRRSTTRLPEDRVFALGRDLARELAAAHAETPPRHPSLEPADIAMADGAPRLGAGLPGDEGEDIFRLGALLTGLALGRPAVPAWRLDGPPRVEVSTVRRRAILSGLASPRRADRYATAADALAALESALSAADAPAPSWPMFRGDAGRSGARPATTAAREVRHCWLARVGAVAASPVIAGDLVIAVTSEGVLCFVDRPTGRLLEKVRVGSAVESSPAVAAGVIHVGTDDGTMVGIGLADGRERYRTKVGALVRSSPLAADGLVTVGTVDAGALGVLVALGEDGRPRWTRRLASVFSSPARAGAAVIVGADDGSVYAFDHATGAPLWSQRIGPKVRATPAVDGDSAYVAAFDGTVAAVRAADGVRRWERALGHAVYSSACLASGIAVFGCHEGHVHGLDMATGAVRFQAETRGPVLASPAAIGARVLASSTDGHLYLLDGSGAVLHRFALPGGATQSSPAAEGDEAFVGGATGLHALGFTP